MSWPLRRRAKISRALTVLVVEDDFDSLDVLEMVLRSCGACVVAARLPIIAITAFYEEHGNRSEFDAVPQSGPGCRTELLWVLQRKGWLGG